MNAIISAMSPRTIARCLVGARGREGLDAQVAAAEVEELARPAD